MEKSAWLGVGAILLVLIALGFFAFTERESEIAINSFEECAAAGNPVMESYPRQCRTKDGRSFTEEIAVVPTSTMIAVSDPLPNAVVSSPLIVRGEARGQWYFEASFPVELLGTDGKQLAISPAQAQGEWMTEEFVPFEGKLIWSATSTTATSGVLIFHKDNPSGLPEHDASVEIPIRF